jgi:4-aminobutyrate aminotransferase / (S)-3-amino-2-methylpropionate transaminase / 5-aminovalerate transaminase
MPDDFVRGVKRLCEEHGILFVDDEVQSGVGRTGPVWAIEHFGVEPDLLVSGKSLGGGLPLAGVTGRAELVDAVPSGGLGGTFGGNPVACAAAIAVLEEVRTSRFRERADEVAATIRARLETLQAQGHKVLEVRGLGPMIAVEFAEQTPDVATAVTNAARDRGLVLLSCGTYGNVVRILVPLSASDDELALGLDRLEESLGDAGAL